MSSALILKVIAYTNFLQLGSAVKFSTSCIVLLLFIMNGSSQSYICAPNDGLGGFVLKRHFYFTLLQMLPILRHNCYFHFILSFHQWTIKIIDLITHVWRSIHYTMTPYINNTIAWWKYTRTLFVFCFARSNFKVSQRKLYMRFCHWDTFRFECDLKWWGFGLCSYMLAYFCVGFCAVHELMVHACVYWPCLWQAPRCLQSA